MATNGTGHNNLLGLMRAFPDEAACARHLEQLRWPDGIVCPLCSSSRKIHRRKRVGIYKCADCRKEFSVRKGTIYEESRLPLQKWYMAAFLMATSRKGISSCQLAREIGVTQKTAWFVLGRLRKSSEQASHKAGTLPGPVEADESYFGGKNKNRHASKKQRNGRGPVGKMAVAGVRSRATGHVSAKKIARPDTATLVPFVESRTTPGSTVYTDEAPAYAALSGYRSATSRTTATGGKRARATSLLSVRAAMRGRRI